MTKAFTNEIDHQHKQLLLPFAQMERVDDTLDWAFRRSKGLAREDDTELVMAMRNIASDPQVWEAYELPGGKREEALGACTAWLEGIGAECIVHGERE